MGTPSPEAIAKLKALPVEKQRELVAKLSPEARANLLAAIRATPTDTTKTVDGVQRRSITTGNKPVEDVPEPDTSDAVDNFVNAHPLTDETVKEKVLKPGFAALQGLTSNLADEGVSAAEAGTRSGVGPFGMLDSDKRGKFLEQYRGSKSDWQPMFDESVKDNFWPYMAGAMLSPNPTGKMGALGRILGAGAQGALAGVGNSHADLTQGDVGGVAEDAALGGGAGLIGGLAGEGLRAGGRYIASKTGPALAAVQGKYRDAMQKQVDEAIASLKGRFGAETQKASRLLENTQRAANGMGTGGGIPVVGMGPQADALRALASPEAQKLAEGVLQNNLADLPGQLGTVNAAKAAMQAAQASAPADVAKKFADYFGQNAFKADIAPRLGRLATRTAQGVALGGAAGGVGGWLAGKDPIDSAGLGAAGGAAMGLNQAGVRAILQNAAKSPLLQARGLELAGGAGVGTMNALGAGLQKSIPAGTMLAKLIADYGVGLPEKQASRLLDSKAQPNGAHLPSRVGSAEPSTDEQASADSNEPGVPVEEDSHGPSVPSWTFPGNATPVQATSFLRALRKHRAGQ